MLLGSLPYMCVFVLLLCSQEHGAPDQQTATPKGLAHTDELIESVYDAVNAFTNHPEFHVMKGLKVSIKAKDSVTGREVVVML